MVIKILEQVKIILLSVPSLVDIQLSKDDTLNVCGDVHGQFYDLANIFDLFGFPSQTNKFLFNGDLVDRGSWSVEVIMVLLGFKLLLPRENPHFPSLANDTQQYLTEGLNSINF